jgi:outer membrane immunogenic protein
MKIFALAATAAAIVATGAQAAAAPGAPFAFNGPFAGIQGGWQQDRQRLQTLDTNGGIATSGQNGSGFGYGGQIGYDYRLPSNFVLGAEVSVTGRTGSNRLVDPFGETFGLRLGRTVNATGRLGYVFSTGGLGYVRGGYSNARFLIDDAVAHNRYNRDGYTVGVGYEQPVARHVNARIEYDYSDYGRDTTTAVGQDYGFADARSKFRRNAVTAGLDFHF